MKFEQYAISRKIKDSLRELSFVKPTDIQYKAIPSILKGEDVLAIAQTGTGKTAAFAIPAINILYTQKRSSSFKGVRCVVMEPTRELVIQTARNFQLIGKYTNISILGLFGGVEQDPQIAKLKKGVDVLIATPGRLFDLISQGYVDLRALQLLILDEADHMLDLGFIDDIRQLIRYLPQKRQTLFFSATINPEIKKLAYSLVHKPVRIQISPKDPVSKNVDHYVSFIQKDDKRFFLEQCIKNNAEHKILVFVRTKVRAERVKKAMGRVEIQAETIHGDKEQKERSAIMRKFSSGEIKVLIATDISARGIDIANISFVVNYDLPDIPENYVHRIGRTGRGTKRGNALSFCSTEEKEILSEIETFLGTPITIISLDKYQYQETIESSHAATHDMQALLRDVESFEEIARKKAKSKKKK
ncbi:MAG: DEAD/DEAH box helicase [Bacteroidales bacterium]|nr:DEAD/DEAH box helicase [Bacteroidales bacterium]